MGVKSELLSDRGGGWSDNKVGLTAVVESGSMKYLMTLLCLLAVLGMAGDTGLQIPDNGTPPEPDGQVRRFEIVSGINPGLQASQTEQTMFRVDAFTGQTWVLRAIPMKVGNGQTASVETWLPLAESNSQIYDLAMKSNGMNLSGK